MKLRDVSTRALLAALTISIASPSLAAELAAAQAPAPAAAGKPYTAPRNEYGQPDFGGVWTHATITPIERPVTYGNRRVLTEEEAAKIENSNRKSVQRQNATTPADLKVQDLGKECRAGGIGSFCGYNNFWVEPGTRIMRINGEKRSSIIIDPVNGRLPPLTPAALAARQQAAAARPRGAESFANPESRPLSERCVEYGGASPMLPGLYNNNVEIVQGRDTIAIRLEMIHDVRIVKLNGEKGPPAVKKWEGDSVGHWEGDTLVVETDNFRPGLGHFGFSETMKVTERFKRISPSQILYRFTVDNPAYTAPFTGELIFNASDKGIYEYACHEANYSLPAILAGAREDERNGKIPSSAERGDEETGEGAPL